MADYTRSKKEKYIHSYDKNVINPFISRLNKITMVLNKPKDISP